MGEVCKERDDVRQGADFLEGNEPNEGDMVKRGGDPSFWLLCRGTKELPRKAPVGRPLGEPAERIVEELSENYLKSSEEV